jgi:hypothetical protein
MFGLFSRSSLDDLLADAERALAGGDAKRAFKIASKALSSAGRNFGRAADAAVVAAEAAERAGTGQVQMFAGLALTLMDDQSKLRERGIAVMRRNSDLAPDCLDDEVISFGWEVDAAVKLSQGDLEGCITALHGACGALVAAFGPDNPKQAGVQSRIAKRLIEAGIDKKQPQLLASIADAGLKRARIGGVAHPTHVSLLRVRLRTALYLNELDVAHEVLVEETALLAGLPEHADGLARAKENLAKIEKALTNRDESAKV